MKKSLKTTLVIILSLIVVAFLSSYFYLNKNIKYQNESLGVELTFSNRWHPSTEKELANLNRSRSGDLLVKAAIIHNQQSGNYLLILTQEVSPSQTFDRDSSIKDMDRQLINKYPSFNKIKAKKIDFLGLEAIDYEFEYGSQEEKRHDRQIILRDEIILYRLIASAPQKDYQANQAEFQRMFNTFQLTK